MISADLIARGVPKHDAEIIESTFDGDTEFIAGLEAVARWITTGERPTERPGSVWSETVDIADAQAVDGITSLNIWLQTLPGEIQTALSAAVSVYLMPPGAASSASSASAQQAQAQPVGNQQNKRLSKDYINILAALGYTFKYNLASYTVEVNSDPLSDVVEAEIRSRLRDAGIYETQVAQDAYTAHAWANRYHPIKDYFEGLSYDGEDYIGRLTEHFVDVHGVFSTFFRRWIVGAVARVYCNAQNRMLVLDAPQGFGKDSFAQWLSEPLPGFYHEGPISPDNKDDRLRLLSTLIWNASELGATTRRQDREALKSFLTIQTVRERPPYGRHDITGPAIASFIGTVNDEGGLLTDPTGNRRFMICTFKSLSDIDWSYKQALRVDDIWSQAYHLYLHGETWDLSSDERAQAAEINKTYETVDIVQETILRYFEVDPTLGDWMSTTEIIDILKDPLKGNLKAGSELDVRRLSSALIRLGLDKPTRRRIGNNQQRGYYGIKRII